MIDQRLSDCVLSYATLKRGWQGDTKQYIELHFIFSSSYLSIFERDVYDYQRPLRMPEVRLAGTLIEFFVIFSSGREC